MHKILLLEDDQNLLDAIVDTLEISEFIVDAFTQPEPALDAALANTYSIIISDINLNTTISGMDFLQVIIEKGLSTPVIMISAYGDISTAVQAMQLGAKDYLPKPFVPEQLIFIIKKYAQLPTSSPATNSINYIAQDAVTLELFKKASQVALKNINLLIEGESGTGKEVVAQFIHANSKFKEGDFIAVNCAAIPENMLEAVLFGYERGAFTNAYNSTAGKFELANNGTIFLDEIGDMPLSLQVKILRVIQEQEVERLGSKKTIKLKQNLICATNKNIAQEVANGKFREDLYYRINVFNLYVQPLRYRVQDIVPLANFFLQKHCKLQEVAPHTIASTALETLELYSWPGNIRELENVIQRALVVANNGVIDKHSLNIDLPLPA